MKPLIGCYYFPGWYRRGGTNHQPVPTELTQPSWDEWQNSMDSSEWRQAIATHPYPRPTLGYYDDANPDVWDLELGWAHQHGIDFLLFDWYYDRGYEYLSGSLRRGYQKSAMNHAVKYALNWCNHGGYWYPKGLEQGPDALLAMFQKLIETDFQEPNYQLIDGKPLFMIYEINQILSQYTPKELRTTLNKARRLAALHGLKGLFIMAMYAGDSAISMDLLKECGFDSFAAYTYVFQRGPYAPGPSVSYRDIVHQTSRVYPFLTKLAKSKSWHYTPCVAPGWDNSPRLGKDAYVVRDLNMPLFREQCRHARASLTPEHPLVLVEAWNEWGEGVFIAPDTEFGFGKLDAIREELAGMHGSHKHEMATAKQIAEWSILSPDEITKANQRVKEDYPLQPVTRTKPQKSAGDPNGQTIWDFRKVEDRKLPRWIGMDAVESPDCAAGVFKQGYAHVVLSNFLVPFKRVKGIRFRYSLLGQRKLLTMRFFWLTTVSGAVDGHFAIDFPAVMDGLWHDVDIKTSDILNWTDSKGDLVNFVFMADAGHGCTFRLQSFEVVM